MKVRHYLPVIFILAVFPGCGENGKILEPNMHDLSGNWDVFHKKYSNTIVGTTFVELIQSDAQVCFLEDDDTLSTGIIVVDTIRCDDIYGLGIYRIFIDDKDHMHSEIPASEYSDGLDFIRSMSNNAIDDIE